MGAPGVIDPTQGVMDQAHQSLAEMRGDLQRIDHLLRTKTLNKDDFLRANDNYQAVQDAQRVILRAEILETKSSIENLGNKMIQQTEAYYLGAVIFLGAFCLLLFYQVVRTKGMLTKLADEIFSVKSILATMERSRQEKAAVPVEGFSETIEPPSEILPEPPSEILPEPPSEILPEPPSEILPEPPVENKAPVGNVAVRFYTPNINV